MSSVIEYSLEQRAKKLAKVLEGFSENEILSAIILRWETTHKYAGDVSKRLQSEVEEEIGIFRAMIRE